MIMSQLNASGWTDSGIANAISVAMPHTSKTSGSASFHGSIGAFALCIRAAPRYGAGAIGCALYGFCGPCTPMPGMLFIGGAIGCGTGCGYCGCGMYACCGGDTAVCMYAAGFCCCGGGCEGGCRAGGGGGPPGAGGGAAGAGGRGAS